MLCLAAFVASTQRVESLSAQVLDLDDLETTIGQLEGGSAVFGLVRTIEVDAVGNVYVLDEQNCWYPSIRPRGQFHCFISSNRKRSWRAMGDSRL